MDALFVLFFRGHQLARLQWCSAKSFRSAELTQAMWGDADYNLATSRRPPLYVTCKDAAKADVLIRGADILRTLSTSESVTVR